MKIYIHKSILIYFFFIFCNFVIFSSCSNSETLIEENKNNNGSMGTQSEIDFQKLFESGYSFHNYLNKEFKKDSLWIENYERADPVREDLLARAEVIPWRWYILIISDEYDSDSKHTIPYTAQLVSQVSGFNLSIIPKSTLKDSSNQDVFLERYKTPDGRTATPVMIILNRDFEERGCWVERPAVLQRWYLDNKKSLTEQKIQSHISNWYERDRGARTLDEIIRIVTAANSGERICPVPLSGLR